MRFRGRCAAIAAATASAAALAFGGTAFAAFPDFTGCPRGTPDLAACIDIQSQSGSIDIKGFHVPLGNSLEIRGGLQEPDGTFIPATGSNGFFAEPVNVPGGLLGLELPISLNQVTATAELAGPPSSIRVSVEDLSISLPLKLRLSNPLIGNNCHIGSNHHPVQLRLIVGTTNPPAPNRPISGHVGTVDIIDEVIQIRGNRNVDNSFSIPGATGCNIFLLTELLINAKLGLPSAGGNNAIQIDSDVAVGAA